MGPAVFVFKDLGCGVFVPKARISIPFRKKFSTVRKERQRKNWRTDIFGTRVLSREVERGFGLLYSGESGYGFHVYYDRILRAEAVAAEAKKISCNSDGVPGCGLDLGSGQTADGP